MHQIERVIIEGFWENHDFILELDKHVNFLIGQNGSGKTTLINLLAAALTADFRTLDRIPFKTVTVDLVPSKAAKPSIQVLKAARKERPFGLVEYVIHPGKGKDIRFSLDDTEEQMVIRRANHDSRYVQQLYNRMATGLVAQLRELVSVNWLSIHRASPADRPEDRSYESSVDRKLESLSNELVRYFATLSRQKDDQVRDFQESMFVALLEEQQEVRFGRGTHGQLARIDEYRSALQNIFRELHVDPQKTQALISEFSRNAEDVRRRLPKDGAPVLLDDVLVILNVKRVESVVDRWEKLQKKLGGIFAPRDKFQQTANELLQRKKMEISPSNELLFISQSGKPLRADMLSSGEKQLLILLSETLLQREQPAIFIADEPELSLHVLWQEKLVSSLRRLNPNAQIIAATHSPDIVGTLTNNAIDMEKLIS